MKKHGSEISVFMAHSQISELIIYLDLTSSGVTVEQDMVELRAVTPN